jgi:hypothetical protein
MVALAVLVLARPEEFRWHESPADDVGGEEADVVHRRHKVNPPGACRKGALPPGAAPAAPGTAATALQETFPLDKDPGFGTWYAMSFPDFAIDERLVSESEKAAFSVFASLVGTSKTGELPDRAIAFADILGNPGEFRRYARGSQGERLAEIDHLLKVFRENAELLVHKTWVEKSDDKRKERLIEEVVSFEREFREGAIRPSFRRFVMLCHSIAHLLFGAQSRADDFLLYTFRIDPKLGLFFWYVGELEAQVHADAGSDELCTMETLLGMYVLSCF